MRRYILVETSIFKIPERLREIDPDLRVLFDTRKQRYVVVGIDYGRNTYQLGSWPYLDQRVLAAIRHSYWIARTTGDPYRQLIRSIDDKEYQDDRELSKATEEMFYRHDNNFRNMIQWRGWRAG